jgi:hypothetical protein
MKIAIIGKGTSAIISALVCIQNGHQVEIHYDPDKPALNVGESTTPHIGKLLTNILDICIGDLRDNGIVSFKNGIKFINWGRGKSDYFRHNFNSNLDAFQFESSIFNTFIHQKMEEVGVKYHPKKISEYRIENDKVHINGHEYDFLIACSGWSSDDDYVKPLFETVNSAILYTENEVDDPTYTLHRATEHGWQFGLPFPDRNLTKCGYLFNSKFHNKEEVQKLLGKEDCKTIDWTPKYAKKMVVSKYEAYNGNRLMFLEPLQALSLYYYVSYAQHICKFLEDRTLETFEVANQLYYQELFDYQISLAFHYSYGSKFDSIFWQDVHARAKDFMNIHPRLSEESLSYAYNYASKYRSENLLNIGVFGYADFRAIHSGMSGMPMSEFTKNVNIPGF